MKVRKYFAENMRSALDLVRQEQGPDVMILSNRKVENGVELVTADGEIDEELIQRFSDQAKARVAERSSQSAQRNFDVEPEDEEKPQSNGHRSVDTLDGTDGRQLWTNPSMTADMQRELNGLKNLIEQQLCGLAWTDYGNKHPNRARLLRMLTRVGIAPSLARTLVESVPDKVAFDTGWALTLEALESRLALLDDPILKSGGRFILCGPSGVGKTVFSCKLAANYALAHGPERIALIATDDQRLGAQQQLKVFGSLVGVEVHAASDASELVAMLDSMPDKELILIDTPGLLTNESFIRNLIDELQSCEIPPLSYLVLSASTDYSSSARILEAAKDFELSGCALTKLDEAAVLGPILSAVVEARLPIAYLSAGEQVPDDLEVPIGRQLIKRTLALAGESTLPEDPTAIERAFTAH